MKRLFILTLILLFCVTPVSASSLEVRRIEGADRYETSLAVNRHFTKTHWAVLVSGQNFPDALAGGPLAAALDAPLYVTRSDEISMELFEQLHTQEVKNIYILGGPRSISMEVERGLSEFAVTRIAGIDRYETAELIVDEMERMRPDGVHYYASGETFADALAASSFVHATEGLLHLVPSYVEVRVTDAIALGGRRSVSGDIARISGPTRFDTALAFAKAYPHKGGIAIVVNGYDFPDALSASGYASSIRAPIFLSDDDGLKENVRTYIQENFNDVVIIGGENSVPIIVEEQLKMQ